MKFTIEKKDLLSISNIAYRAASTKSTIPLLSGLLLQLDHETGLTLTSTDMEIGIKASTREVEIIEPGTLVVNAHYFNDLIRLLPDKPIKFSFNQETSKLMLNYGRSTGSINTYPAEDYPDLPLQKKASSFFLPQDVLKEGLRKTVFAATTNHFRQVFTGVLFDILETGQVNIVASDTHRLARYICRLEEEKREPFHFIVPIRAVNELLRIIGDQEEKIEVSFAENNIIFSKNNIILLSRLIDGQYPNYEQVIPHKFVSHILIKSDVLSRSLERIRVIPGNDKYKIQHVQLSFNEGELWLNSASENAGEITEFIEQAEIDGDESVKIAFNTNYFLDVVRILESEGEKISIDLSGSLGPAIIKNPDDDKYLYVLVPLRTTGQRE